MRRNRKYYRAGWLVISLPLLMCLGACTDPPPPSLDYEWRRRADTVVLEEGRMLNAEIDSICTSVFDSLVRRAYDSILEQRLSELEKIGR